MLVVIAGLQIALPGEGPGPSLAGLAARRQKPIGLPPSPEFNAILASPVFSPDRRPGSGSGPADTGSGAALAGYAALGAASARGVATGVVSSPAGGLKTVKRGELVDGWRLAEITPTKLIFERNGVRRTLVVGAPAEAAAAPTGGAAADLGAGAQ